MLGNFQNFFFISLSSLKILFTEKNSSLLIYDSIKALEIITSIVFNLSFPNNTSILQCFFFFFFIIDSHFVITAVIAQMFIPTAELVIPIAIQTNQANAEIETQPVTVQARISKVST